MTDIVERLRAMADHYRHAQLGYIEPEFCTAIADEIDDLRQAVWDAFAIMGGDIDGDESHKATTPAQGWADFLRQLAREWRKDYDDACDEARP